MPESNKPEQELIVINTMAESAEADLTPQVNLSNTDVEEIGALTKINRYLKEKPSSIAGMAVAIGATGALLAACDIFRGEEEKPAAVATDDSSETPSPSPSPEVCEDTWAVEHANNENNRLIAEGVPSLAEAETDQEAREAAAEWFNLIKQDPELLAGTSKAILGTEHKSEDLHDGTCFNSAGEQVATELELVIAGAEISADDPDANGYNTGTDDQGEVGVSANSGITGDTSGITMRIKKHGSEEEVEVGLLKRCGNMVFIVPPKIPEVPTDEEFPDKVPQPLPGPVPGPGAGGSPEEGMDPENDSDFDGYGPGDTIPTPKNNNPKPEEDPTNDSAPNGEKPTVKPQPEPTETTTPTEAPSEDDGGEEPDPNETPTGDPNDIP